MEIGQNNRVFTLLAVTHVAQQYRTHLCAAMATLSIAVTFLTLRERSKHTVTLHDNGNANVTQCYVTCTLRSLFQLTGTAQNS